MRSIPLMMTWELIKRGRMGMLLGAAGANLMPGIVLTALRGEGAVDPAEQGMVTMQMLMPQFMNFILGSAILSAHQFNSRFNTLPVTTPTLVACRMFPGMLLMSLVTFFNALLMNQIFGINWPALVPALFAPAAFAMIQASIWYSEKSPLQVVYVIITAAVIGLWYKARHGEIFSQPSHTWTVITPSEVITLLICAVAAYFVALAGATRVRCGEPLAKRGIIVWLERCMNYSPQFSNSKPLKFQTPCEAQFWSEWRKKGWLQPFLVLILAMIGFAGWLVFSRKAEDLIELAIAGGVVLMVAAMLGGLILGNCGTNDANTDMGQFLGTRPLTNRDMARTTLKVIALSVLNAWVIWVVLFGVIVGMVVVTGTAPQPLIPADVKWWYVPAMLVGSWIITAASASVCLMGRAPLLAKIFCLCFGIYIGEFLLARFMSRETQAWLYASTMVLIGMAMVMLVGWTMIVARRKLLIGTGEQLLAGFTWIACSAITVGECLRVTTVPVAVLFVGLAALGIAPFAVAPLAITWNRHR